MWYTKPATVSCTKRTGNRIDFPRECYITTFHRGAHKYTEYVSLSKLGALLLDMGYTMRHATATAWRLEATTGCDLQFTYILN